MRGSALYPGGRQTVADSWTGWLLGPPWGQPPRRKGHIPLVEAVLRSWGNPERALHWKAVCTQCSQQTHVGGTLLCPQPPTPPHYPHCRIIQRSCPRCRSGTLCSPPGSSVHGILQGRILEWVAIPFSSGSSQPRDQTRAPALQEDFLPSEPSGKPLLDIIPTPNLLGRITFPSSLLPSTHIQLVSKFCLFNPSIYIHISMQLSSSPRVSTPSSN